MEVAGYGGVGRDDTTACAIARSVAALACASPVARTRVFSLRRLSLLATFLTLLAVTCFACIVCIAPVHECAMEADYWRQREGGEGERVQLSRVSLCVEISLRCCFLCEGELVANQLKRATMRMCA